MTTKGKSRLVLPPHGTIKRYHHRVYPCKCISCRDAYNAYMKEYRRERMKKTGEKLNHGKFVPYDH